MGNGPRRITVDWIAVHRSALLRLAEEALDGEAVYVAETLREWADTD